MIEWKENLATGVNEIDNQHKELFRRINKLFTVCQHGQCNVLYGKNEVIKTMLFLEEYVHIHFSSEEFLQLNNKYPEYKNHKSEHTQFMEYFFDLKTLYTDQGSSEIFLHQLNSLLVDWLTQHIHKVDKAFADFLRKNPGG